VVALTRAGTMLAYDTDAPPCPLGSWPRFHHDNANSGDYRRDAVAPGKPVDATLSGRTVTFTAPGDDLLCGTADHYELVTSNAPIAGGDFADAEALPGAPDPEVAGTEQSFELPAGVQAFVALRAVDEQGNPGRPVVFRTGYPRPKSASPVQVSLVPAHRECTAPNAQHGPPLAHPSCNPPAQESAALTVGTPDANGLGANATASVRFSVRFGDPSTPEDEADVRLALSATDVRARPDLSDYTGEVTVATSVRITDRNNAPAAGGGSDPATVTDVPLEIPAGCAATAASQVGGTCDLVTTIDSVLPGAVREGDRAIWQMGRVEVLDDAGAPFLRQGVFIP
jgi:hypothetical protein